MAIVDWLNEPEVAVSAAKLLIQEFEFHFAGSSETAQCSPITFFLYLDLDYLASMLHDLLHQFVFFRSIFWPQFSHLIRLFATVGHLFNCHHLICAHIPCLGNEKDTVGTCCNQNIHCNINYLLLTCCLSRSL